MLVIEMHSGYSAENRALGIPAIPCYSEKCIEQKMREKIKDRFLDGFVQDHNFFSQVFHRGSHRFRIGFSQDSHGFLKSFS